MSFKIALIAVMVAMLSCVNGPEDSVRIVNRVDNSVDVTQEGGNIVAMLRWRNDSATVHAPEGAVLVAKWRDGSIVKLRTFTMENGARWEVKP